MGSKCEVGKIASTQWLGQVAQVRSQQQEPVKVATHCMEVKNADCKEESSLKTIISWSRRVTNYLEHATVKTHTNLSVTLHHEAAQRRN